MSKVRELIKEGKSIVEGNKKKGLYGIEYVSGVEYEEWIAKVVFFLEDNKEEVPEFLYKRVIKKASHPGCFFNALQRALFLL